MFPPEIFLNIAEFATVEVLGNLRLASSELCRVSTTAWAEKAFKHIIVHMNHTDVSRLVDICNRSHIAQHVETIAVKTIKPSTTRIHELVDDEDLSELAKNGVVKHYFSGLVKCSDSYERFVESGEMFRCMQRVFQCLRLNQGRTVKIRIWNDKRDLEDRFENARDLMSAGFDDDSDYDWLFEGNHDDIYEFSDMTPVRVLLALLRSGLMVQSLDVPITGSLSISPWTETLEALKRRDNIKIDHPRDKLTDSVLVNSIKSLTIRNLATARDLHFRSNNDPSRCALQLLLRSAVNLQNLEMYYYPYASGNYETIACNRIDYQENSCLSSLSNAASNQPLRRLRLNQVGIDADALVQLLRSVAPTLEELRLKSIVTQGSRRALESFHLSELTHLKVWVIRVEYHTHNDDYLRNGLPFCTREVWNSRTGSPKDFGV